MVHAWIAPDPNASSLRTELLSPDVMDALAHSLKYGPFTSAEVHRDATIDDLAHGNERVVGHLGSSNLEHYYPRHRDPDWAVIFDTDCPGDPERGRDLLEQAGYLEKESPPEPA